MTADLLVIIPTRSRPHNVARLVEAWDVTGAFDVADLLLVVDADDPALDAYLDEADKAAQRHGQPVTTQVAPRWEPLVPKLNRAARLDLEVNPPRFAYGFAGDDHVPRTPGWPQLLLDAPLQHGTGIAYPDDGHRGEGLPTTWYSTADIVDRFGMVPAPVEHLYCDNAIRDLGRAAGCLTYVPGVLVEHMNPFAGKAERDEQYNRVNGREQYRTDRRAYRQWRDLDLPRQAAELRAMLTGENR